MRARDVMTTKVVKVSADTPVEKIARTLLGREISGVPVVDDAGHLAGIVSEGDLVRRVESETARPASWWLRLIASPDEWAQGYVQSHGRRAGDVMTREVVAVEEETTLAEIAALLERKRIKRVPVLRNGQVVGIVSRANLLHGVATMKPDQPSPTTNDRQIRESIVAALTNEAGVNDTFVNVTVRDGIVHLWGLVDSDAQRAAARVLAENTPGVRTAVDHLDLIPPNLRSMLWT